LEDVSRLDDGVVAIRGGRIHIYLEAGSVVPVDVAPNDPANNEQVMREKPVSTIPKTIKTPKQTQTNDTGNHFLYAVLYGVVTKAIVTTGLDPFYGLVHALKSGRLSLTYDLSEVFKPLAIHAVIQASRKARLRTLRGSRMLTPKTIEVITSHLYGRISREGERLYNRKSLWILPIREIAKFKDSILKRFKYEAYTYDPASGS